MSRSKTLFAKLFRKQRGNCHLCGGGMSRVQNKPNFATFDHIIPKSKMRTMAISFIRDNKKLACKKCNEERADKLLTNQTREGE
jgi:5-methylcytosine-specific restriction endonuclease McrA